MLRVLRPHEAHNDPAPPDPAPPEPRPQAIGREPLSGPATLADLTLPFTAAIVDLGGAPGGPGSDARGGRGQPA